MSIIKIYQETISLLETLTSPTSELPICDKIFIRNCNSSKFILLSSFSKVMSSYLLSLARTMNYEECFSSLGTITSRLFYVKCFKLNLILFWDLYFVLIYLILDFILLKVTFCDSSLHLVLSRKWGVIDFKER